MDDISNMDDMDTLHSLDSFDSDEAFALFSSESFKDQELFKSLVEYCLLYKKGIIN